jgi:hypothetical protein
MALQTLLPVSLAVLVGVCLGSTGEGNMNGGE